jgi:TonB family protein
MEKKEVQGILNQPQPGFFKVLIISFLLHALTLSAGLFLVKAEPKRIFFTPVYTVELVSPPQLKPKPKPKIKKKAPVKVAPKKVKKKKVAKKAPAVAKEPVKVKKKAPPRAVTPSVKEKVYLSEAISRIEKEAQKKEEKTLMASRIDEIKRKAEAEKKKVETLRKDIADEEEINKRLEALKKEIASAESETKTVDVAPTDKAPTPLPSRAAPRRVTRELFDLEFKAYYNRVGTRIQSLWVYAGTDKGLETWISIKIARSGELKEAVFEKRSGNTLFDESALRAVKKAAPFPPLPEGIGGDFLEVGVRFCPGGCKRLL